MISLLCGCLGNKSSQAYDSTHGTGTTLNRPSNGFELLEFSISPDNPSKGTDIKVNVKLRDESGVKGFELSSLSKKLTISCENKKTCSEEVLIHIPLKAPGKLKIELAAMNEDGEIITKEKELDLIEGKYDDNLIPPESTKEIIIPALDELRSLETIWDYDFEGGWDAERTYCSWSKRNIGAKKWDWAQMQGEWAAEVVNDPVNAGNKVVRFEWRRGEGGDCDQNSKKKAHLYGATSDINKAYYWSFDLFFPTEGMELDSKAEIVIQWHGKPDDDCGRAFCEGRRNPPLAVDIKRDELTVTWIYDVRNYTPAGFKDWDRQTINLGKVPKDRWINLEFYIDWDPFGAGALVVWMDGEKVIDKRNIPIGFNDNRGPFLGFGFYKYGYESDHEKRINYFDNIKQAIVE